MLKVKFVMNVKVLLYCCEEQCGLLYAKKTTCNGCLFALQVGLEPTTP